MTTKPLSSLSQYYIKS